MNPVLPRVAGTPALVPTRPLAHVVPWTQHEIAIYVFLAYLVYILWVVFCA